MKATHWRRLLLFKVLNRLILALHVIIDKVLIIVLHSSTSDILEKAERYVGENVCTFIIPDKCDVFKWILFSVRCFYGKSVSAAFLQSFDKQNTKNGRRCAKPSHFLPLKMGTALSPQAKAVQHPTGSRFLK